MHACIYKVYTYMHIFIAMFKLRLNIPIPGLRLQITFVFRHRGDQNSELPGIKKYTAQQNLKTLMVEKGGVEFYINKRCIAKLIIKLPNHY